MLRDIFYGFTFNTSLTLDDQLRQVVCFFAWTVPSTFVSWVQQIGVQVSLNINHKLPILLFSYLYLLTFQKTKFFQIQMVLPICKHFYKLACRYSTLNCIIVQRYHKHPYNASRKIRCFLI